MLAARAIGRIVAVRAEVGEYLPGWHPYEDYRQMYASRADLGGGVVLSQIHEIDYLYWLFGMPRRLMAMGGHLSSLEIDVEDTASILMECVVDGRPIPVHLHQDYVQRPPSRTCQIIGDDGKILVDFRSLSVTHFDGGGRLADASLLYDASSATSYSSMKCDISWPASTVASFPWCPCATGRRACGSRWPQNNRYSPANRWTLESEEP